MLQAAAGSGDGATKEAAVAQTHAPARARGHHRPRRGWRRSPGDYVAAGWCSGAGRGEPQPGRERLSLPGLAAEVGASNQKPRCCPRRRASAGKATKPRQRAPPGRLRGPRGQCDAERHNWSGGKMYDNALGLVRRVSGAAGPGPRAVAGESRCTLRMPLRCLFAVVRGLCMTGATATSFSARESLMA